MGGKSQKDKKKKKGNFGEKCKDDWKETRVSVCGASSQAASTRGRSQPIGIILRRVQEARKREKKKGIGTFIHYYRSAEAKNIYIL